jgi:Ca-activated chloride channel family protein
MPNNNFPQVLITPLKPALILGMAQKLPVLVRVQTPDAPPSEKPARKPYHLALVIDRSGSMSGEPIREAVRCARHIVDRLAPSDQASLIVFDDRVKTLVGAQAVGDRKALHMALSRIHEGGSTNLHGGWKAGADGLLPGAADSALARVILLSDGNANVGEITETEPIAALCQEAATKGVTTSTYGLGRDFNEDLMVGMAKSGQGNHYYGDTAADLFEPFGEEFDLISNLHSRHVKLALGAPEGVKMTLLNDYPVEAREGFPLIRLPDIPYGAEAWAIVELEISAGLALDSGNQLLQVGVTASSPEGEPIAFPEASLTLKALSPAAWDAVLPDPLVAGRLAELAVAQLLVQARKAADAGDWEAIDRMLADARQRYAQFPWVIEVLESAEEIAQMRDMAKFSKESLYSSRKMHSRLSAKDEVMAMSAESDKASYLRRKKAQGKAQFDRPDDRQP